MTNQEVSYKILKLQTKDEALVRREQLFNWFMEVRKNFHNIELHKNIVNDIIVIYFIGNRIAGNEFERFGWKTKPLIKFEILTLPQEKGYYIDMDFMFSTSIGMTSNSLTEIQFKQKVTSNIQLSIDTFLTTKI